MILTYAYLPKTLEAVNNAIIFGAITRGARFFNYGGGQESNFVMEFRGRKSTKI
jgi:hypothetical protein